MYRFESLSAVSTFLITLLALYTGVSPGLTAFLLTAAAQCKSTTVADLFFVATQSDRSHSCQLNTWPVQDVWFAADGLRISGAGCRNASFRARTTRLHRPASGLAFVQRRHCARGCYHTVRTASRPFVVECIIAHSRWLHSCSPRTDR